MPTMLSDFHVTEFSEEFEENGAAIAIPLIMLQLTLEQFLGYYAQLRQEAALSNSDTREMVVLLQSGSSAMVSLSQSLFDQLRMSPWLLRGWQKIMNSEDWMSLLKVTAQEIFVG